MTIKEPLFWYKKPSFLNYLLSPLGWFYAMGGSVLALFTKQKRVSCPVICIGNLVVGGTGKTPTALKLAVELQKNGHQVHFLTRGYGGKLKGPIKVNPNFHKPEDVGDEALLLGQVAPTWKGADRVKTAQRAVEAGATILIMDDGFQNHSLHKDLSLVVVDGSRGFGNGFIIPAGPLREPLSQGLNRADGIILIGDMDWKFDKPVYQARLRPTESSLSTLSPKPYIAFCGIGNPNKFFKTLEDCHVNLVEKITFPDHHPFTDGDICNLKNLAQRRKLGLITTRKDWIRLPFHFQEMVTVIDVELEFEDEGLFHTLLSKIETL